MSSSRVTLVAKHGTYSHINIYINGNTSKYTRLCMHVMLKDAPSFQTDKITRKKTNAGDSPQSVK